MSVVLRSFAVAGACAIALTACGGDKEKSPATPVTTSAAPASVATSAAAGDSTALLEAAKGGFAKATDVHVKGSMVTDQDKVSLDVYLQGDDAKGTIALPMGGKNVKVEIIQVGGKGYFRSPELMSTMFAPGVAKQVGDRWAVLPAEQAQAFAMFSSRKGFADLLAPAGTVTVGEKTKVNGKDALPLSDGSDQILFLAADGDHLPISFGDKANPAQILFTYGDKTAIEAPADAIDPAKK